MIDNRPEGGKEAAPGATARRLPRGILGAVCVLVVGFYVWTAQSGFLETVNSRPADAYYNLLVQGFRAGHLSLQKEVPSGLTQLSDPYDPIANGVYRAAYGMDDLSYSKGRLYLYFGVTPVLLLFWPYAVLTSHYLLQSHAAVVFSLIGFLVSVGLLHGVWRRWFPEVGVGVVAACVLALGLATAMPVMLARADVYEVSISCGYMLTMLALAALWRAWHVPDRSGWWLAAASAAYGLALGARPSLLFGAVILLVPVVYAWRQQRPVGALLAAAIIPIGLIGLGLLIYNAMRFGDPFEFGVRYQLSGRRQDIVQRFGWQYLWFNFRIYFLEPARWSGRFPFVREILVSPVPAGYATVENPFGVLINCPVVWLALAAPLAWRGQLAATRSSLQWFVASVAVLFGTSALTLCFYFGGCVRYEVEFVPELVLLAAIGIFGLERTMRSASGTGPAGGVARWRAVRWGWSLLLAFSVAFNVLASVALWPKAGSASEIAPQEMDRLQEAIAQYEQALRTKADLTEARYNLEIALARTARGEEAIRYYEEALRIKPDSTEAQQALARLRAGR